MDGGVSFEDGVGFDKSSRVQWWILVWSVEPKVLGNWGRWARVRHSDLHMGKVP